MTAQIVKACNQKISDLSQAIVMLTGSDNKEVKERAQRKTLLMIEQQVELTRESIALHEKGMTFEAWKEMFLRLNSPKFIRRVDNAQGEIAKVMKILTEQGDLEAYYTQEIAFPDKTLIDGLRASLPQLEKLYSHMQTFVG